MAREDKDKTELEEILVNTDIDTEAYRSRLHNQLDVLMDRLDVRAVDHPQWLVKTFKDTEDPGAAAEGLDRLEEEPV